MKLNGKEKRWILYDVGNSAFVLLVATIIPIYFNYLAGKAGLSDVDYLAYWGYVASICTVIVAILGPILGTIADTKGYKKPIFMISILIGTIACSLLGLMVQWMAFLIVFLIAKVGFSASLIFYDSMLSDITDEERMDYVSSQGYAWGYIGSCVPFVLCLVIVLGSDTLGIRMETAMGIAFVLVAVWWLLMSLPLLKNYEQKYYVEKKPHAIAQSFKRLGETFKNMKEEKQVFHGSAKEAISILPTKVNVAIAASLASSGPENVDMSIFSVPEMVGDDHKITAQIPGVKAELDIYSSTSAIAGWSVVAVLRNLVSPIVF